MEENHTADLAALRAAAAAAESAAAEAEAVAAQARAAAAQAALEAAEHAAASPAAPESAASGSAAPESAAASPPPAGASEQAATIAAGYRADVPQLALGALMERDRPVPGITIGVPLAALNRHGLVAGATGTGKTRTLQVMAEGLSEAGVPVFLADIKGDLSGLAVPGQGSEKLLERTNGIGQDWSPAAYPVEFYSLGGIGRGVPIRTTVTDFGPLLLAKVLDLNETQESALTLIVHWADQQGLALLDLKDLRSVIAYLTSDEGKGELKGIGGIATATAGVVLREISALEAQGGDVFFGEPAFATADLLRRTDDGRGVISALELPALQDRPAVFSTFLMWLLADLFGELPEVGDVEKPKLVFFFDEAHVLFTGASKAFTEQVVQTVRLIRSKGVGIFFITQTPKDVPDDVLAQLGSRVQHALRAHTPNDATALRATVRTYPTSEYDLEELLTSLGTGEAVVTVLDDDGVPTPVAWTRMRAPRASMDPAPEQTMDQVITASPGQAAYGTAVDRESAFELLTQRIEAEDRAAEEAAAAAAKAEELQEMETALRKEAEAARKAEERQSQQSAQAGRSVLTSVLRTAGTTLAREVTRSLFGTRRRR
ncbi:helicase HerA-like domain-containing protein [Ruania halotolerans]|uniref:helicase HerA-like domain-containing protein n=1 Tax=Ruania halotolerans TaxID=2897773 RepID=UPI001E32F34C|nr:helicase HerA-like domain-containing protein [Ruania halotolerans]UFU04953.1 DUF853 domain-containing protein [Ruania halotolerans]